MHGAVGLENSVRRFELGLRLKRSTDQQLFQNNRPAFLNVFSFP
jgi:exonuclease VII small subunit